MSDSAILAALSGKSVMRVNQDLARELSRNRANPAYVSALIAIGSFPTSFMSAS